jgi:hypothetical protein
VLKLSGEVNDAELESFIENSHALNPNLKGRRVASMIKDTLRAESR